MHIAVLIRKASLYSQTVTVETNPLPEIDWENGENLILITSKLAAKARLRNGSQRS
jgi:hypothetical protein